MRSATASRTAATRTWRIGYVAPRDELPHGVRVHSETIQSAHAPHGISRRPAIGRRRRLAASTPSAYRLAPAVAADAYAGSREVSTIGAFGEESFAASA